jgi:Ras-related GTP-binding protein A/B
VPPAEKEAFFQAKVRAIEARSCGLEIIPFKTSIWDETLYKAWSNIVFCLIPNIRTLEEHLDRLTEACGADEIVLFEKSTFLVISSSTRTPHPDVHRFEKVSNIVKQFKLSCQKAQSQFRGLRTGNGQFSATIDHFTGNTYLMVVSSTGAKGAQGAPGQGDEATLLNIALARDHFEELIAGI